MLDSAFNLSVVQNAKFQFKSAEIIDIDYDKKVANGSAKVVGEFGLEIIFYWHFDTDISQRRQLPFIPTEGWNWEQIGFDDWDLDHPSLSLNNNCIDEKLISELQNQDKDAYEAHYFEFLEKIVAEVDWETHIVKKIHNSSRILKPVSFNKIDEADLIEFIKEYIPNFSYYVKTKIENDIEEFGLAQIQEEKQKLSKSDKIEKAVTYCTIKQIQ